MRHSIPVSIPHKHASRVTTQTRSCDLVFVHTRPRKQKGQSDTVFPHLRLNGAQVSFLLLLFNHHRLFPTFASLHLHR